MKTTTATKKFAAIKTDANQIMINGNYYAFEASYVIFATDEERANEMLAEVEQGEFYLMNLGSPKDMMGRYYPESIRKASL